VGPDSAVEQARGRLSGLLPEEALHDALKRLEPDEITGPGGLVSQLAGRVSETALGAELTEHLGYPPGRAPPGGAGNHRNGPKATTVQTDLGPVQVRTPRDRNGFDKEDRIRAHVQLCRLALLLIRTPRTRPTTPGATCAASSSACSRAPSAAPPALSTTPAKPPPPSCGSCAPSASTRRPPSPRTRSPPSPTRPKHRL
jgi:hypothetical protein